MNGRKGAGPTRIGKQTCVCVCVSRHGAEGVRTTAEAVQRALEDARAAQDTADKAISNARQDLRDTEDHLAQVHTHTHKHTHTAHTHMYTQVCPGRVSCVCVCVQIELETSRGEQQLGGVVGRLGGLQEGMELLKTQRASNSMAAARAEETATMARDKATEAKQVCVWLEV